MPLERYDKFFGGHPGAAAESKAAMHKAYGRKDGEHVFWATIAKRKRKQRGGGLFGKRAKK